MVAHVLEDQILSYEVASFDPKHAGLESSKHLRFGILIKGTKGRTKGRREDFDYTPEI